MCTSAPLTAPVFSLPTSVREVQRHRSLWQQVGSIVALSHATILQHKVRKSSRALCGLQNVQPCQCFNALAATSV